MSPIARARSFNRRRKPHTSTSIDKGTHVRDPRALVEVHREEPAGFILEERVDAYHMPAREVPDDRGVVDRDKCLIRAVAALDLW